MKLTVVGASAAPDLESAAGVDNDGEPAAVVEVADGQWMPGDGVISAVPTGQRVPTSPRSAVGDQQGGAARPVEVGEDRDAGAAVESELRWADLVADGPCRGRDGDDSGAEPDGGQQVGHDDEEVVGEVYCEGSLVVRKERFIAVEEVVQNA